MKLTAERVKQIGEELRTTRIKGTTRPAFEHVFNKYRNEFLEYGGFDGFLYIMKVFATFFASQGEKTAEIRSNTKYIYV
jgi:hypothetical protein